MPAPESPRSACLSSSNDSSGESPRATTGDWDWDCTSPGRLWKPTEDRSPSKAVWARDPFFGCSSRGAPLALAPLRITRALTVTVALDKYQELLRPDRFSHDVIRTNRFAAPLP